MRRTILLYGFLLAILVFVLKLLEYRMFVRDMAMETFIGFIAVFFMVLGLALGLKLTRKKSLVPPPLPTPAPANDIRPEDDDALLKQTGISRREYEVLELMARGLSNQEIADTLFVSLNTVKTHSSNLFLKLEVKRRTQAVQRAKAMGVLKNA